jgi:hypothetical protein
MKTALAIIIWISIGTGVQVAWFKNHGREPPSRMDVFFFGSMMWPTYVAIDVYRAVGHRTASTEGGDA